ELKDVIEFFQKETSKYSKKTNYTVSQRKAGKYLYEISIPDLHLSKLCWSDETGYQNYDIEIACNLYRNAVEDLLSKIDLDSVERFLLPVGNDFFNSDGMQMMTTAGTP